MSIKLNPLTGKFDQDTDKFTQLKDAPSSFSGQIGKFVKVNPSESALIFSTESDPVWSSEKASYSTTSAADLLYAPISVVNYTLPTASASVLGGIKVGSRLSIAAGVLSADVQTTDITGKQDLNTVLTELTALTDPAADRVVIWNDTTNNFEFLSYANWNTAYGWGNHASAGYYVGDGSAFAPALGLDDNYVTDAQVTLLGNTSGTNSGDNATNTQYSGLATSKLNIDQTTPQTTVGTFTFKRIVVQSDDATVPVLIKRKSGSTSLLQSWQNETGTIDEAYINYRGAGYFNQNNENSIGLSVKKNVFIDTGASSVIGITVKGRTSQTADLQDWTDVGDNILANISAVGNLTLGYASNPRSNSLNLISSYVGGQDDGSGTDTTSRMNLYSYQRASSGSFGENIRHYMMRADAKSIDAWYFPHDGYDSSSNPVGTMKPVVWAGAHWQSNDHLSLHKHWSVETPDSTGAIQTRFEIRFGDVTNNGAIAGLDKTFIGTNLADFVVRTSNSQVLRLQGSVGVDMPIEFNHSYEGDTSGKRWVLKANSDAESGSNAGTNFSIERFNDSGTSLGEVLNINRATGYFGVGITPTSLGHFSGANALVNIANTVTSGRSAFYLNNVGGQRAGFFYYDIAYPSYPLAGALRIYMDDITGTRGNVIMDNLNKFGLYTSAPTKNFGIGADADRTLGMERHTASNSVGHNLTINAGGASVQGAIGSIQATPTNGGTGYTVGDILTITGGDGTAKCLVYAIGAGGAVTGLSMNVLGSGYSVGAGNATTGGTGTSCTMEITSAIGSSNKAGGDLYITGGTSVGTGASNVYIQTSTAGSTGSTDNAPTTKVSILGNGNVGLTNKITTYNNVATEGYGVSAIVDNVALTAQAASIGTTNFTNAGTAGTYRVNYYLEATTLNAGATSVLATFGYTDDAGATTTVSATLVLTALGRVSGSFYVRLASGNITYATTLVDISGLARYALYVDCQRLS